MSFLDQFLDWSHAALLDDEFATSYLLGRGASEDQFIRHRLGFVRSEYQVDSTTDLHHNSEVCGDKDRLNLWCDSCRFNRWSTSWEDPGGGKPWIRHQGQRIVGCIVFPLTTYSGAHIGFQIRSLKEKKYDSFTLRRRPEGYFFGTSQATTRIWSSESVFLVEGPGDHLVLERLIAPNVLALTTSSPSVGQVLFLRRFAKRVILCLDLDAAGRHGVKNFIHRFGSDIEVFDIRYGVLSPVLKDIGDLWKRVGDAEFKTRFCRAMAEAGCAL